MSLLRDRLEQRIAARLAYVRTIDPSRVDGIDAAELAVRIERNVIATAEAIIPSKAERLAALDREIVGRNWPLFSGFPIGEAVVPILLFRQDESPHWPPRVSFQETGETLERIGTPESKAMAAPLLAGVWDWVVPFFEAVPSTGTLECTIGYPMTVGATPELLAKLGKTEEEFVREQQAAQAIEEVEHKKSKALIKKLGAEQLWSPHGIATLLAALAEVRAGALAFRGTPIPATRPMRVALQTISRGGSGDWGPVEETRGGRSFVKLHWPGPGSTPPHQLALSFPGSVDVEIVAGILDELQEEGLRDYLVLHRMAAEQGRTGEIIWSWREHRKRTAYDRRIRAGNQRGREAQKAVTARLWRLKGAELRETVAMPGGKTRFVRIGPFGLIDIPAGYGDEGGALDLAPIKLNPAIYSGAAVGTAKREKNFTMLPDSAFALDGRALRLAVLLALQMRNTRDDAAGTVRITASKLWEWLCVRGGDPKAIPRKRWQATDDTLRKVLAALEDASVIGTWNREGGEDALPGALYQIDPVAEWRDAVVHRVPPALPPSKAAIPRTGEELRLWRGERLLSQAAAAAELGVGVATVKRAEAAPQKELGAALVEALARGRAVSRSG